MLLMENLLPPCYNGLKSLFLGSGLQIGGEANLTVAIQVAQLALKHRQNKQQQQRIIVFVGRYSLIACAVLLNHTSLFDFYISPLQPSNR